MRRSRLIGEIPKSMGNLTALEILDLSSNDLSGNIPSGLFLLENLTTLYLYKNHLSWAIPKSVETSKMEVIDLSQNNLTGTIPDDFGRLTKLWSLTLSFNRLSGRIPARLWDNLEYLNISNNLFMGHLPDGLYSNNLSQIDISNNKFSGEIQAGGIYWNSLSVFQASNNLFSGSICQELAGQILPEIGLLRLTSLNLSLSRLTGRIPVEYEMAIFYASFLNNSGLCASNPLFELNVCSSGLPNWIKLSSNPFAIVASIAAIIFVLSLLSLFFIKRVKRKGNHETILTWNLTAFQMLDFTESDIVSSLTESNVIGKGGSGKVYHVAVNRSGIFVAVKRIWNGKKLDQRLEKEFLAEVQILGMIRHSNIVKLLCCITTKILVNHGELNTMSIVAGTFGYIAPVTGKEANDGDEDMCLAKSAWQHIQEGNPIVDALDEEVKEACYLDEMAGVFKLGIICTGTLPSTRPSMKEVLQILLGCSQQLPLREDNVRSNYGGVAPLHTNSRHERMVEDNDDGLALDV
ncbi:Receptor-like protein kinase HSL1 [Camellia lanceoleosa]|uniref:Receptor-like protein kinase HSL1 n=1 Tax=Camellia lanceoleosa TaxID=1840588 RepID=A0ACC0FIJ9_9ERIC|nr:Receptor-like protein kinase HSL1 [Camellia lanceoleosa]